MLAKTKVKMVKKIETNTGWF